MRNTRNTAYVVTGFDGQTVALRAILLPSTASQIVLPRAQIASVSSNALTGIITVETTGGRIYRVWATGLGPQAFGVRSLLELKRHPRKRIESKFPGW